MKMRRERPKTKGMFERVPGSDRWSIRWANAVGKIEREDVGTWSVAKALLEKRRTEKLDARKVPEKRRRRIVLFSEIAADGLDWSRENKASHRDDKSRMKRLVEWFGEREVASIRGHELEAKLCTMAKTEEWASSTYNHYRSLLMMVYREAERCEKVHENSARKIRHREEDNSRVRNLSADEEKRIRTAIRKKYPWHEPEFDIALHTGLRQGLQYSLEWSMINWEKRELNIPTKTPRGKPRPVVVALNKNALSALRRVRPTGRRTGRLFCALKTGQPMRSPRMWFDEIIKDAKIVNFHWHDLRHCFATRLRAKGARLVDIADALGHKTLAMSRRYAHLGEEGLHDVVALLEHDEDAGDTKTDTSLPTVSATSEQLPVF
jgi:integrase